MRYAMLIIIYYFILCFEENMARRERKERDSGKSRVENGASSEA